jgi:hypothetical protein
MTAVVEKTRGSGSGVTSLVLGLVALTFLLSMWSFAYVPVAALAALSFGVLGFRPDHAGRGMAIAGVVLADVSLVVFLIGILP